MAARRWHRAPVRRRSGIRCPGSPTLRLTTSSTTSRAWPRSTAPPGPGCCRRCRGSLPARTTATIRREPGDRSGLRDQPDQHDHARAGLEVHRDLPDLGRRGRGSTTTWYRPGRTPMDTGCACLAW